MYGYTQGKVYIAFIIALIFWRWTLFKAMIGILILVAYWVGCKDEEHRKLSAPRSEKDDTHKFMDFNDWLATRGYENEQMLRTRIVGICGGKEEDVNAVLAGYKTEFADWCKRNGFKPLI